MNQSVNALKLNQEDNVAVALTDLKKGTLLKVYGETDEIKVIKNIPYGHKVALTAIQKNGQIIKYGECMGVATQDIPKGVHVHIENVRGLKSGERL